MMVHGRCQEDVNLNSFPLSFLLVPISNQPSSISEMGTHKSSKTKNASCPARKHKPLSTLTKSAFAARNTKSRHFPPSSPAPAPAPAPATTTATSTATAVEGVKVIKGWEAWEEKLFISSRKAGRTVTEISKDLPGRSRGACYNKWFNALKFRSQDPGSGQDEVPASTPTGAQYWIKEWEDWEDQIVTEQRSAGETWEDISKFLHPRSTAAVKTRWFDHLRFSAQERVERQTRARTPPPSDKSKKLSNRWNKYELVLLLTLRVAGKSWEEISKFFPTRTAYSVKDRYHYFRKQQVSGRKPAYLRSGTQEVVASRPQSPSPPSTKPPGKVSNAWTEQEDQLLLSFRHEGIGWAEIASKFPYHSKKGCEARWREHLSPRKGISRIWTPEDEQRLDSLYRSHPDDWEHIASHFTDRTWLGCKMHWQARIRGPIANPRPRWKKIEIETLVDLYNTIGPRWREIAKHIPGRTEATIEEKFYIDRGKWDGLGGPASKYWEDYFESKFLKSRQYHVE